jgi:DNA mismatch endonuclease (patch repair protein)
MALNRSQVMARIRSKGTRLEERFKSLIREAGLKVRRGDALFGRPDFRVLPQDTLVFVNSCFWHGCRWHCRLPHSRRSYWVPKIRRNVQRQREVVKELRRDGHSVVVIWEHTIQRSPERVIQKLLKASLVKPHRLR